MSALDDDDDAFDFDRTQPAEMREAMIAPPQRARRSKGAVALPPAPPVKLPLPANIDDWDDDYEPAAASSSQHDSSSPASSRQSPKTTSRPACETSAW